MKDLFCPRATAHAVKPGASNLEPLRRRLPVHVALVKQLESFSDQFRTDSMR